MDPPDDFPRSKCVPVLAPVSWGWIPAGTITGTMRPF